MPVEKIPPGGGGTFLPKLVGSGELNITSHGVLATEPPLHSAGVWGVIASQTDIGTIQAAGPSADAAVVAYTPELFDALYAEGAGNAVHAVSHSADLNHAAVYGSNDKGGPAGKFDGNVYISGDIFLTGADCAEEFDIAGGILPEPGTVMVITDSGQLEPCGKAYDRRVAGVISGAGNFRSGLVLDKQKEARDRSPIALSGKTFCRVDAGFGGVEIGDLLTTSAHAGYAMKASDAGHAFGAVIGKALRALPEGTGLIPILVALQ
jgi:hypothetical protein